MNDSISRQQAIDVIACAIWHYPNLSFLSDYDHAHELAEDALKRLPSEEPEIIRCKECKHKPHTSDKYDYDNGDCGFEIIFPDFRCPCRCEDEYYNHIPDDDWYCGNAERREECAIV